MNFSLSDDQREIQRTARELLAARATSERVRGCAEARRSDEELWRELSELGWLGIAVQERYGGQGLGSVELSILCEEMGRSVAPVPFLPTVLAAAVIQHAGSEEQRERLLPALASGRCKGAVCPGCDASNLTIGGAEADVVVVPYERLLLGVADVGVEPVAAIDPTRSAAHLSIPDGAGEELPGDVAGAMDRALVAVASELVGVCDRALQMTVAYVKERKQFGVPVGAFQAVSHRCAQMLLETEKARSLTAFAAWAADAEPERLHEAARMAKAAASEAGVNVTASAIQAHGGIGFTWEADVHWLFKRAHIDAALLGGAREHSSMLASELFDRIGETALS